MNLVLGAVGVSGLKAGVEPRRDGDNPISLMLPNGSRIVGVPGNAETVRGFSGVSLLSKAPHNSDYGEQRFMVRTSFVPMPGVHFDTISCA